jgi:hypothetical protein
VIPALTCLLLPFAGQCSNFVREVPRIADVVQHRAHYSGKLLSVTGRVQTLDQWKSRSGLEEELFSLCEDGCIRVYLPAHSPIRNGERVTVRGTYYEALHVGRATFYNELEGTEVLPRE